MPAIASIDFTGKSGKKYTFNVYPLGTKFKDIRAVYAFTKRTPKENTHTQAVLYVGESEKLGDRISNHEKLECVKPLGCNCICVHSEDNEVARMAKEKDLIENYDPPCNK